MISVRFASGLVVEYSQAFFLVHGSGTTPHRLYTRKDGDLVATAPPAAIVEFVKPQSTYMTDNKSLNQQAENVLENIEQISSHLAAELKTKLTRFNAKQWFWKDE